MAQVFPSLVVDLIDRTFKVAKTQTEAQNQVFHIDKTYSSTIAAIIGLLNRIPQELLTFSGHNSILYYSSVLALENSLEMWKSSNKPLDRIPGLGFRNPVSIIRQILAECPDEFPSKDTNKLVFIDHSALRLNLEIDISATNKALSNGEWKAANVLSGSIIEALILWSLSKFSEEEVGKAGDQLLKDGVFQSKPSKNLDQWNLHQYIEVALKLDVITSDTATQLRLAKEFRNLIHPGREKRLQKKCNRATALSAAAGVEHIVNDFQTYYNEQSTS